MSEQELTEKIRDYILVIYNAEYNGLLSVTKTDTEYIFRIGLPSYMSPTVMCGNFETDDEFLEYIYSEVRTRNYMKVYMYRINKLVDPKED